MSQGGAGEEWAVPGLHAPKVSVFTDNELPPKPCSRCKEPVPHLIWLSNAVPELTATGQVDLNSKPRHCCDDCFEYYTDKTEKIKKTLLRTATRHASTPAPSSHANHHQGRIAGGVDVQSIYAKTLSARRPDLGYKGAPVAPLPSQGLAPPVAHNPYVGLNSQLPRQLSPAPWAAPDAQQSQPGYTSAHMHYDEDRTRYMRQGSSGGSLGRVLTVKVQAFYELEKATLTKFCEPFENVLDTLAVDPTASPSSIAKLVRTLMEQNFDERKAQFRYFSFNLKEAMVKDPIVGTNLEKPTLELSCPRGYYYDLVMVEKAARGKKAAIRVPTEKQFKQPKTTPVVGFILPYAQYSSYLDYIVQQEINDSQQSARSTKWTAKEIWPSENDTSTASPPPRSKRQLDQSKTSMKKAKVTAASEDSEKKSATADHRIDPLIISDDGNDSDDSSVYGKKSPAEPAATSASVDGKALFQAMMAGGSSSVEAAEIDSFRNITENVVAYTVPAVHLEALYKAPNFKQLITQPRAIPAVLAVVAHQRIGKGAFKTAHLGTILNGGSAVKILQQHLKGSSIIVKRPYKTAKGGAVDRHPPLVEAEELINECNIIYWANALMSKTHAYIDSIDKIKGVPPMGVPRPRFAAAGFCVVNQSSASTDGHSFVISSRLKHKNALSPTMQRSYMLEEKIAGKFMKFIHNQDPHPAIKPGQYGYDVAQYLCFTQHVQYVLTDKTAFISDYQGKSFRCKQSAPPLSKVCTTGSEEVLTDPQLMTRNLGMDVFGAGNVASAFQAFEQKHACNRFCKWYDMKPFGLD